MSSTDQNPQNSSSFLGDQRPLFAWVLGLGPEAFAALPPHIRGSLEPVLFVTPKALAPDRLSGPEAPQIILSPLVTPEFDASEIAGYVAFWKGVEVDAADGESSDDLGSGKSCNI